MNVSLTLGIALVEIIMAKTNRPFLGSKNFTDYEFDTSKYIVMELKVKRDSATGRLAEKKTSKNKKQKEIV